MKTHKGASDLEKYGFPRVRFFKVKGAPWGEDCRMLTSIEFETIHYGPLAREPEPAK